MAIKTLDELEQLAFKVFLNSNVSENNAAHVVRALVQAEADGVPSHGLSRVPSYADQAKSGKVNGHAIARLEQTATAALRVDANGGYAYPAIHLGLGRAMTLAQEAGIVGLAIGNSHHGGVGGHPVEAAARKGLIAMGFLNAPAAIAPWNGNRALYGTNPIAFACPRRNADGTDWGDPILVDLALSKVARGKIMMAAGEPPKVGQFFILIDPSAFAHEDEETADNRFIERIGTLVQAITEQDGAWLPGVDRWANRAKANAEGVEVADKLLEDLEAVRTWSWISPRTRPGNGNGSATLPPRRGLATP